MSRSRLMVALLLLMCLVVLGSPARAGVVEDAEDSLQAVPSDNPAQRNLDGGEGRAGLLPSIGSGSESSSSSSSSAGGQTGLGSAGSSSASGGAGTGVSGQPHGQKSPDPALQEAATRRQARDRVDRSVTFMGALLLLALVVMAGLFSKRYGRDD